MTAIEQIEAQQAEAQLKARADLLLLADVLAQGEQPPPDALAILTSAGATAEQLEKLVTIAKERLSLEPRAAALPQILADRAKADAELAAATETASAEVKTAHENAEAKPAPLRPKVNDLAERERDARYSRQRLQTLTASRAAAEGRPNPHTRRRERRPARRVRPHGRRGAGGGRVQRHQRGGQERLDRRRVHAGEARPQNVW